MPRHSVVAGPVLLLLLGLAGDVLAGSPVKDGEVPPRTGPSVTLSHAALWGRLRGQARPGEAIVGLKRPGARRGIWKSELLVSAHELEEAKRILRRVPGVEILQEDELRPFVVVRFADAVALQVTRALGVVDYVHPRYFKSQLSSSSGCDQVPYENSDRKGPTKELFTVDQVTHWAPGFSGYHDFVSWSFLDLTEVAARATTPNYTFQLFDPDFKGHRIPEAWRRVGGGAGVRIGSVDTGVFNSQDQLGSSFAAGKSANRQHVRLNATSEPIGDTCGHGTLSASTAAGPMDDTSFAKSLVGVAWQANLATAKVGSDVWLGGEDDYAAAARGIRYVVCGGYTCGYHGDLPPGTPHVIVSMAFGDQTFIPGNADEEWQADAVKDEIAWWYGKGVLFLGAAGTDVCGEDNTALYPAALPQVLAVGCTDPATGRRTDTGILVWNHKSCRTSEFTGVWNPDVAANGATAADIWKFGGSSSCVGAVAGIAALVWSSHPNLTRADMRERLENAGHMWPMSDSHTGFGVVNAFKAVGGLLSSDIETPSTALPGQVVTVSQPEVSTEPGRRYEWTDGTCSGSCRHNGTACTGPCPLVGTCPAGQAQPYCTQITRAAADRPGGQVKTKLTIFDEASLDQTDEIAMKESAVASTCSVRTCAGRCGYVLDGCGPGYGYRNGVPMSEGFGTLNCGACAGWYGLDVTWDSSALPVREPIGSQQLTSFEAQGGNPRVYYVGANRHLVELYWTAPYYKWLPTSSGELFFKVWIGGVWSSSDIFYGLSGVQLPAANAALVGFALQNGTLPRLYYVSDTNRIQETAWTGERWSTANITAATSGATTAALGSLAAFAIQGSLSRVYYLSSNGDGHVHELAWTGSGWQHADLMNIGAPVALANSALSGFAESGSNPRVYYLRRDNAHVVELAWQNGWHWLDVSQMASPVVPAAGTTSLNSYALGGQLTRVHYLDDSNRVRELAWTGAVWQQQDVTTAAGVPASGLPVAGSALAGFAVNGGDPRVYYQSADGHVRELAWDYGWHASDLTAGVAGGSPAKLGSPLSGFAQKGNLPRVYSVGENAAHVPGVRELTHQY